MGDKMRVYELAATLGLDNKVLLERLKVAGIEAKNHLSVLDAAALAVFDGEVAAVETSAPEVAEQKVEEQRINPGIIRRRRKETPKAAPAAEEPTATPASAEAEKDSVAPVAEAVSEDQSEESAEPADEGILPEPVVEETAPVKAGSEALAQAKDDVEATQPTAETPQPTTKTEEPVPEVREATASQAKILGRVEISQLTPAKRTASPRPSRPRN